ncbi:acyl-coenzyme A thioesterase 8-like isoform X1 [Quercus lobata]|uniref:acyl-coenzyme A thioesterase 8-like isoform X1 n=1 Tax=Quercus lobata TaxID=97700 RepID=UPI0012455229|nr:acyl-coenzyme A thioesterase 8-like isoform X1 [Quercus lobata]
MGNIVFTLLSPFQKEEGFEHQRCFHRWKRRLTDPHLPRTYGNKVATTNFIPWPIEIQFCEPNASTNQTKSPPRCVVAYTSDLIFLQVSMNPHHRKNLKTSAVSLDHWMHFHWPLRADDCLLFVVCAIKCLVLIFSFVWMLVLASLFWLFPQINSPAAYNARGFDSAKIFNRKREHVASATQEGLIRVIKNPIPPVTSKL